MSIEEQKAAHAAGCRIQIWHLIPGATSSADGQWDTCEGRPKFECPIHLYRVHPDDLHMLEAKPSLTDCSRSLDAAVDVLCELTGERRAFIADDIRFDHLYDAANRIFSIGRDLHATPKPAAVVDEAIVEVAARAIYKKQGFPFEWDDVDAAYRDIATDLARTALTATASLAQPQDLEAQAVDLEQFREAVELLKEAAVSKAKAHEYTWGSPPESWQREGLALAEANRLLAIIDAQSAKGGGQ